MSSNFSQAYSFLAHEEECDSFTINEEGDSPKSVPETIQLNKGADDLYSLSKRNPRSHSLVKEMEDNECSPNS